MILLFCQFEAIFLLISSRVIGRRSPQTVTILYGMCSHHSLSLYYWIRHCPIPYLLVERRRDYMSGQTVFHRHVWCWSAETNIYVFLLDGPYWLTFKHIHCISGLVVMMLVFQIRKSPYQVNWRGGFDSLLMHLFLFFYHFYKIGLSVPLLLFYLLQSWEWVSKWISSLNQLRSTP